MQKIADSITELIGNTPILRLNNYCKTFEIGATILAKLEYFNPMGSVKDRIGFAMIKDAEEKGLISKNTVLIEPTSGNTGIGLALAAAAMGYRLIITLPDSYTVERRNLMKALGAELVLTPGAEGMPGAIRKAEELAKELKDAYIMQQFDNPANPKVHRETTAKEIWEATEGKVDIFVAGVGTGGTITGVAEVLKQKNPEIQIVTLEPDECRFLTGGPVKYHKLQGLAPSFIPKVLNKELLDEIIPVKSEDAIQTCRDLAKTEGILAGISSGAALFVAKQIACRPENTGKNIVVILPDSGERYLSTQLFDV